LGNKWPAFIDNGRDFPYSDVEFERVLPYRNSEVEPILSRLFGRNMVENLKLSESKNYDELVDEALTMYIIIRNVSAIEYFLRQTARKIVDSNNRSRGIDFSKFFSIDFETEFQEANRRRRESGIRELSRGEAFANHGEFMNPRDIDKVFSRLLGIKFFETIQKTNIRAGKQPWGCRDRPRGLRKNWKNFINMFEQRHNIVHRMERIRLSREELCYLCNNTSIFMELTNIQAYGANPGGNEEQDFLNERITEQEELRREELERSTKPSKPWRKKKQKQNAEKKQNRLVSGST
jgi:hypothetical protein